MVVTVSSYAAYITVPNMTDYAASKVAALSFHGWLPAELKTRHNAPRVRTAVIIPGHTKTPLFQGFSNDSGFLVPASEPQTVAEAIVKQVPTGRSGQSNDSRLWSGDGDFERLSALDAVECEE